MKCMAGRIAQLDGVVSVGDVELFQVPGLPGVSAVNINQGVLGGIRDFHVAVTRAGTISAIVAIRVGITIPVRVRAIPAPTRTVPAPAAAIKSAAVKAPVPKSASTETPLRGGRRHQDHERQ